MKNATEIRYDELRAGDVIYWSGVKEIVEETIDEGESNNFPGERVIRFKLMPFDEESERLLGKFYSHGTYGGVGFLRVDLIHRGLPYCM